MHHGQQTQQHGSNMCVEEIFLYGWCNGTEKDIYGGDISLVVRHGDYEVTPRTHQAHSQNSTCCVPRSTCLPPPGALAGHYRSQVDTIGQPNHVGEAMSPM